MISRQQFHQSFYLLATIVLAASLPLSHFLMGLSCFIIFLNWIAEWNWNEKWKRMVNNRQFLLFSAFYIVFAIGLFNATDFKAASNEMLSKITFLLAPIIIISSKQLKNKELQVILTVFVLATIFGCLWNTIYALTHNFWDFRAISRFIDHIRFGLCVVISIVFCCFYAIKLRNCNKKLSLLYSLCAFLLLIYLLFSQTLSGIVILFFITLSFIFYLSFKIKNKKTKTISITAISTILLVSSLYFCLITISYFRPKEAVPNYSSVTAAGRTYNFDNSSIIENGYYIGYYVCEEELKTAWNFRSDSTYNSDISNTLIRYLNSKGLHKDSAAVMSLTDKDIKNIEQKFANIEYTKFFSTKKALYQTFFGFTLYNKYNIYTESSLLQRFELWKASWGLIKENYIFGVGIGNQRAALDKRLEKINSPIAHKKKDRGSHNQFITFWLTSGILTLIYFVFILIYPFVGIPDKINFVYFALILTIILSMIVEDTLNAQTGRLLYTIFAPLILFSEK